MIDFLRRLLLDEDGPTAVEYAVMLALIVIVCIGSISLFGDQTAGSFEDSSNQLDAAIN